MNPIIHVINLDRENIIDPYANPQLKEEIRRFREERALSIVKQSKIHGFSVRFWEGETGEEVFRCKYISRAFKKIVMYAKEENLEHITIAEDDMVLTANGAWKYYLENWPEDFDTYLGGVYQAEIQEGRIMNGYSGNTLITIHERFYDFFLSANEEDHLDRWLGIYAHEKRYMVCIP